MKKIITLIFLFVMSNVFSAYNAVDLTKTNKTIQKKPPFNDEGPGGNGGNGSGGGK